MEADIGDELVALDPDAGKCFGFNEVATTVWRLLEQPRDFEEIRAVLLDRYEVGEEQCTSELRQLLEVLVAKGLLDSSGGNGNKAG
jgi:hypothetical protein